MATRSRPSGRRVSPRHSTSRMTQRLAETLRSSRTSAVRLPGLWHLWAASSTLWSGKQYQHALCVVLTHLGHLEPMVGRACETFRESVRLGGVPELEQGSPLVDEMPLDHVQALPGHGHPVRPSVDGGDRVLRLAGDIVGGHPRRIRDYGREASCSMSAAARAQDDIECKVRRHCSDSPPAPRSALPTPWPTRCWEGRCVDARSRSAVSSSRQERSWRRTGR